MSHRCPDLAGPVRLALLREGADEPAVDLAALLCCCLLSVVFCCCLFSVVFCYVIILCGCSCRPCSIFIYCIGVMVVVYIISIIVVIITVVLVIAIC